MIKTKKGHVKLAGSPQMLYAELAGIMAALMEAEENGSKVAKAMIIHAIDIAERIDIAEVSRKEGTMFKAYAIRERKSNERI